MGRGWTGTMAPLYAPGVLGPGGYPPVVSRRCWEGALLGLLPIASPNLGERVCIGVGGAVSIWDSMPTPMPRLMLW